MCGVWVAFEDVGDDAGPLLYYPKSHKLPIYLNEHLGTVPHSDDYPDGTYPHFVALWRRLVEAHGLQPAEFHPTKGQALIWAANLLHGGLPQRDKIRLAGVRSLTISLKIAPTTRRSRRFPISVRWNIAKN